MNGRRNTPRAKTALLVACALLVSLAQPLSAVAALGDCGSCDHGALDATCCCAPQQEAPPLAVEESCCSEPATEPSETEYAPEPECSCKSVPDVPVLPVLLPPVQDIAAAGVPARLVAAGCTISMRTVLSLGGAPLDPGASGGSTPPDTEPDNGTRLGRAAVQGTSTFLALLSVARL